MQKVIIMEDFETAQEAAEYVNTLAESCILTIEAQAGQINLSLQQLLTLTSGQTFDLAPLPPKVKLLINGVVIGDGFLVELNGRVGVKIASLTGQGLPHAG